MTHAPATPWIEIQRAVEQEDVADLTHSALKNRYRGKGLPDGAVNTTITFH